MYNFSGRWILCFRHEKYEGFLSNQGKISGIWRYDSLVSHERFLEKEICLLGNDEEGRRKMDCRLSVKYIEIKWSRWWCCASREPLRPNPSHPEVWRFSREMLIICHYSLHIILVKLLWRLWALKILNQVLLCTNILFL